MPSSNAYSLYPSVCIENTFPVGSGIHLKGPRMTSRLSLDYEKGCFMYTNPTDGTCKEIDGILQVIVGIPRDLVDVNNLPFLPIRCAPDGRTYRASCFKCLTSRKKSLCKHDDFQRRWRETYNARELAYAITTLKYTLYCIEECLIYDTLLPIFKNFMHLMSSKKIRHSKIPPSYKTDLEAYCSTINSAMKFSHSRDILSPDLLEENEYECSFDKSIMNIGTFKKTTGIKRCLLRICVIVEGFSHTL